MFSILLLTFSRLHIRHSFSSFDANWTYTLELFSNKMILYIVIFIASIVVIIFLFFLFLFNHNFFIFKVFLHLNRSIKSLKILSESLRLKVLLSGNKVNWIWNFLRIYQTFVFFFVWHSHFDLFLLVEVVNNLKNHFLLLFIFIILFVILLLTFDEFPFFQQFE